MCKCSELLGAHVFFSLYWFACCSYSLHIAMVAAIATAAAAATDGNGNGKQSREKMWT